MSKILSAILLLLAGVALNAACWGLEGQQEEELDQVITDGAKFTPCKITKDNYVSVEGKYASVSAKAYSCNVKEVLYADRNNDYNTAIDLRDTNQYRKAGLRFYTALQGMKDVKWAEEYCNYYLGCVFFADGDFAGYTGKSGIKYEPPAVYFQKVLAKNPKTRFLPDLLPKLVRALAEEGKFAEAEAAAKDAEARLKTYQDDTSRANAGFTPLVALTKVQLLAAQARLADCKAAKDPAPANWAAAHDAWHKVETQAKNYPELLTESTNGEWMALINMKQTDQAKNEANAMIDEFRKAGDPKLLPVLPGAYTVLGLADFHQALEFEARKNMAPAQKLFADARWNFINVIGQFFENEDFVAQSYYYAGLCYDKLRDIEPDAGDKAVRSWKVIVRDFSNSGYKAMAEKELQRVAALIPAAAPAPAATPAAPVTPQAPPKAPAGK